MHEHMCVKTHTHTYTHGWGVGLTRDEDRPREDKKTNDMRPKPSWPHLRVHVLVSGLFRCKGKSVLSFEEQKEHFRKNIWPQNIALVTLGEHHFHSPRSDGSVPITSAKRILVVSTGKSIEKVVCSAKENKWKIMTILYRKKSIVLFQCFSQKPSTLTVC